MAAAELQLVLAETVPPAQVRHPRNLLAPSLLRLEELVSWHRRVLSLVLHQVARFQYWQPVARALSSLDLICLAEEVSLAHMA